MTDIAAIARLIEPEVKSLGYDLVRVAMIGGTSDPTLQVMAERPDTRQLDLADCERISRRLSDVLDANDPIEGSLSARGQLARHRPAADPPARTIADWAGHRGADHASPSRSSGRKQVSGTLEGIEGETRHARSAKDGEDYALAVRQYRVGQAALDRQAHQRHRAAQHRRRRHDSRP